MTGAFPRVSVLGFGVDAAEAPAVLARVESWLAEDRPRQIVTANALMVLAASRRADLAEVFHAADLVVPDSAGVAWAMSRAGHPHPPLAGIDLMDKLCACAARAGRRVFFLGGAPGVADAAAQALARRHPGLAVAGARHGFFSDADEPSLLSAVAAAKADLLFVALATPRQDVWIHRRLSALGVKVAMGVGGSFDVFAGRLRRAPSWMRAAGLEWMFRLIQEPSRAGRMLGLPVFAAKVLVSRR